LMMMMMMTTMVMILGKTVLCRWTTSRNLNLTFSTDCAPKEAKQQRWYCIIFSCFITFQRTCIALLQWCIHNPSQASFIFFNTNVGTPELKSSCWHHNTSRFKIPFCWMRKVTIHVK
jgi:hypothetical protein